MTSLSDFPVSPGIAVSDMGRARSFYEDKLGLRRKGADGPDDNHAYECAGGTVLHVFVSPHAGRHQTTQCGFMVTGIESVVAELAERGVEFDQVHDAGIDTDDAGIAHFDGGAKVAYFRDPDGNVLSLGEAPT